jgi:SAM-dependent methyltransferase
VFQVTGPDETASRLAGAMAEHQHPEHRFFAAFYDRLQATNEAKGLADRRRSLLAGARGRVLEIGAGTGLNLRHYQPGVVTSLVALEPDAAMRRQLVRRLAECPVPCTVSEASVDEACFPDSSFDTIVATLVFCSLPDPDGAAAAMARWLTSGGRLLFLEHVRGVGLRGLAQRAVTPVWALPFAGCRLDRDTIEILRRAGLAVTDCERFAMPAGGPLLRTCAQGVARPRPLQPEDPEDHEGARP